jgi:hypothetical protein
MALFLNCFLQQAALVVCALPREGTENSPGPDAGTGPHGCHGAISDRQQPFLLESVTHTGNDGHIHGIIGVLTEENFACQGHTQQVQARSVSVQ